MIFQPGFGPVFKTLTQKRSSVIRIIVFLYVLIHIFTLPIHPFVHSDEAWLAVLTRSMLVEKTPAAVEDVFRLVSRYPHALKTLYHLIQAPFLAISWSAVSARLPSLIAGGFSLVFITGIASRIGITKRLCFLPGVLMAVDPQFWYVSHLGRQEMILTALFLLSWSLKSRNQSPWIVALPLSSAIFVHPNAFILSIPIAMMYMLDCFFPVAIHSRKVYKHCSLWSVWENTVGKIKSLCIFCVMLGGGALLAVGLSYWMDSDFLSHYANFGNSVGAGDSIQEKILGFPVFVSKMWSRKSGTYFLADIRPQMIIGAMGFLWTLLSLFFPENLKKKRYRKRALSILCVPVSLFAGMILVGKYGPPSITFMMPPAYLLFAVALGSVNEKVTNARSTAYIRKTPHPETLLAIFLPMAILFSMTIKEISRSIQSPSYSSYQYFLQDNISNEGRVLANLNTAFSFDYDRLVIWRDLENLDGGREAMKAFLKKNDVRWIVYSDELELVFNSRPVWNALYGNPFWYPQLLDIIRLQGRKTAEEVFPNYAMRILPYMDRESWSSVIYRVQQ